MIITQQDVIRKRLAGEGTASDAYIIKDLIESHNPEALLKGARYYHNENKIKNRQIWFYDETGKKTVDEAATNNKIPHNWHKLLVDQKVSYFLGRPPVISAPDEQYTQAINDWLDEYFDDALQELGKNASNKGKEHLHPFIDEKGNFDYIVIPAEQVIVIYDTAYQRNIVAAIRYYPFVINGVETIRAEWWDEKTVTYWIKTPEGYVLDDAVENNPDSHFYYNNKGYGWERVPFVEFRNNEEMYSDLKYYNEIIDIYDLVVSDMANDLTDLAKLIYVLKGYDGTSLEEFKRNLQYFRAVKVNESGGLNTMNAEVLTEAIDSFLDRTEENIFLFGQGVNIKTDKFGANPTGVALKFLYTSLDLKANIMARKFTRGIKEFIWFLTEWMKLAGKGQYDADTVKVTFSKSMLTNDLELVTMGQQSKGVISDETIVTNHPWVDDVQEEIGRLEKEATGRIDLDDIDDDDEGDDEE